MKIEVLMSTFNGQKYIEEQINSIINQKDVKIHLTIRDDGSKDGTVAIIKKSMQKYPQMISMIEGNNLGYKKSFIELLSHVDGTATYYAFSDQDDVWKSEKCIQAVNRIEGRYDLYVSSVENCNEKLEVLSKNDLSRGIQSLKSDFIRHRFPGCTMLFSEKIRKKALQVTQLIKDKSIIPSHDFVISSIAYCCGNVLVDSESYILHRRTEESLTSRGSGIMDRIKTEWRVLMKAQGESYCMACLLIDGLQLHEFDTNYIFLKKVVDYKRSFKHRIALVLEKDFKSGMVLCDIETKLKIVMNRF